MSVTRYFLCTQGRHDKFWNISLKDRAYIVQFGRNGTGGQGRVKTFINSLDAEAAYHKKILEKLGKGYYETTGDYATPVKPDAVAIEPKPKAAEVDLLQQPKRAISFD